MKNVIYICFLLAGCATFSNSENEYYHRLSSKPTIVEESISDDEKLERVINPFAVSIVVTVDCDTDRKPRVLALKESSEKDFKVFSKVRHNCSVEYWEVK